ncbi:TetR/AcrR family transcriptional regulator [Propionicicella superfundia]|uniref:TetR/AcrR family transcriptional regulator n=1 Tax=Propionicicella superfundia TaxID=348582 RepID=UPI0006880A2A|nr:TetR/AcrR family transcriptional regulator [Propionicicella superfundia]
MEDATPKGGYHHGDLRRALCHAGYALAREGGLPAVTLRETTRRAGVTAAAAYRHFDGLDDLLLAVASLGMGDLARAIERRQALVTATDPADRAVGLLEAVGLGYIDFALDEPGAFDVALSGLLTMEHAEDDGSTGTSGRTPYQLLTDAIAVVVAEGLLSPGRAEPATVLCWSAVHGFATLAVHGPIRTYPRDALDTLAAELVSGVVRGVRNGPADQNSRSAESSIPRNAS